MTIVGNKQMRKYPTLSLLSSFDHGEPHCQTLAMLQTLARRLGGRHQKPHHQAYHAVSQWKLICASCSAEKQATEPGKGELALQSRCSARGRTPARLAFPSHARPSCHRTAWVGVLPSQLARASHVLLCLGQRGLKG